MGGQAHGQQAGADQARRSASASRTDRGGQSSFDYDVEAGVAYSYEIEIGVRRRPRPRFALEPQVKEETLIYHDARGGRSRCWNGAVRAPPRSTMTATSSELGAELLATETALGALRDPARFGDIDLVRRTMLDWRFYHDFRSDRDSPLRQPCLAVTTPTLASDGTDLAAVFATLVHIREDTSDLDPRHRRRIPGRAARRSAARAAPRRSG